MIEAHKKMFNKNNNWGEKKVHLKEQRSNAQWDRRELKKIESTPTPVQSELTVRDYAIV